MAALFNEDAIWWNLNPHPLQAKGAAPKTQPPQSTLGVEVIGSG